MKMIELTKEKFEDFAKTNKYNNFCQTENYALSMKYDNFKHKYIAYTTNDLEILAAGMFLIKSINPTTAYAYCPKGFIIDYENTELVRKFSKNITKYLKRKNIIFLKVNPEFPIATINYKNNYERKDLPTNNTLLEMKKIGFMRRKEINPFELLEPKLTALVNLKEYDYNKLDEEIKRKVENNKGYEIEVSDITKIDKLTQFSNPLLFDYYKNIYENFKKDNLIDLLLLKINYEKYLIEAKNNVEKEQETNDYLNEQLQKEITEENLNKKMLSDKILEEYKQQVVYATAGLKKNEDSYLAGALIIKYKNKITLLVADINKEYEQLEPNYYLYNKIFEMYKDEYEIADLYGIANDFTKDSKYEKLNKVKLSFNPIVYETAGELDIIINKFKYKIYSNNIAYSRIKNKAN